MSVKTLSNIRSLGASIPASASLTYSIAPSLPSPIQQRPEARSTEVESFLEGENPLGCFRGVMWVMAFNAAVFLLGFVIWQSCKYLW
jgi:hypothetical protein